MTPTMYVMTNDDDVYSCVWQTSVCGREYKMMKKSNCHFICARKKEVAFNCLHCINDKHIFISFNYVDTTPLYKRALFISTSFHHRTLNICQHFILIASNILHLTMSRKKHFYILGILDFFPPLSFGTSVTFLLRRCFIMSCQLWTSHM